MFLHPPKVFSALLWTLIMQMKSSGFQLLFHSLPKALPSLFSPIHAWKGNHSWGCRNRAEIITISAPFLQPAEGFPLTSMCGGRTLHRAVGMELKSSRSQLCSSSLQRDISFPFPSLLATFSAGFLIDFGKLAETIANSDYMIVGHLAINHRCKLVAKHPKQYFTTAGSALLA